MTPAKRTLRRPHIRIRSAGSVVCLAIGLVMCPLVRAQPSPSGNKTLVPRQAQASRFIFSPYKNVNLHIDPHTGSMRTAVTGTLMPIVGKGSLLATRLPGLDAITLAFADGECGHEHWGKIPGQRFADDNIPRLNAAGVDYIISTGGEGHMFTCADAAGMMKFISRYMSPHMVGVDFDIEDKQTPAEVRALAAQVARAEKRYPKLRFSFTIATWAGSDGSHNGVNSLGTTVIRAIQAAHLSHYTIDLMVMDYGSTSPHVCVGSAGRCDMGLSAIQAVHNLQYDFGIPASRIAVTPMIGANDTPGEVFTVDDVDTLARYVVHHGLAGVHFWSLDRDAPCSSKHAASNCNSVPATQALQYTERFLEDLDPTLRGLPHFGVSCSNAVDGCNTRTDRRELSDGRSTPLVDALSARRSR